MTVYAVFDTNVIVSAMITPNSDAPTVKVLEMVANGRIIPLFNNEIITEYDEVLHRDKFRLREKDISNMIGLILDRGVLSYRITSDSLFVDAADAVFYEVALSKDGAYLVTGNTRHFPTKPLVVTPAEMLQIMNGL